MNDEIGKITEEKQDYQEYVESFVHEIKIPIGALSLTFDNTKNYTLKKETDKNISVSGTNALLCKKRKYGKGLFCKTVAVRRSDT